MAKLTEIYKVILNLKMFKIFQTKKFINRYVIINSIYVYKVALLSVSYLAKVRHYIHIFIS